MIGLLLLVIEDPCDWRRGLQTRQGSRQCQSSIKKTDQMTDYQYLALRVRPVAQQAPASCTAGRCCCPGSFDSQHRVPQVIGHALMNHPPFFRKYVLLLPQLRSAKGFRQQGANVCAWFLFLKASYHCNKERARRYYWVWESGRDQLAACDQRKISTS